MTHWIDEMVTLHLTPDEALALVAGPIVEGRDVSYAVKDAYGKVWDALKEKDDG
jgi:hypothetical protein